MRRRDLIKTGLAAGAQMLMHPLAGSASASPKIPYGTAVRGDALIDDFDYRNAIVEHCDLVVAEGGMKWDSIRPAADTFDFYEGDKLIRFAESNGMKMRGHTLVWYAAMPEWTAAIRGKADAEREMTRHVSTVVSRYRSRIPSWDVVNEAVADEPTRSDYLRPSLWLNTIGKNYIEKAFRCAAENDPAAQLVINEYDIEFVGDRFRRRREALLKIVRELKDRDAPIHAVGFQGHLKGDLEIDREGVSNFVSELKKMDVAVLVTEMDVIDNLLPADETSRDEAIAGRVGDFLGAIFDATRPSAVLTWGISDRYTWVPMYFTRDDGKLNRPLPLDRQYRPKPFMRVIEEFASRAA